MVLNRLLTAVRAEIRTTAERLSNAAANKELVLDLVKDQFDALGTIAVIGTEKCITVYQAVRAIAVPSETEIEAVEKFINASEKLEEILSPKVGKADVSGDNVTISSYLEKVAADAVAGAVGRLNVGDKNINLEVTVTVTEDADVVANVDGDEVRLRGLIADLRGQISSWAEEDGIQVTYMATWDSLMKAGRYCAQQSADKSTRIERHGMLNHFAKVKSEIDSAE
jgi:hypothetical protein